MRAHLDMLASRPAGGVMVLCAFGENPLTGEVLPAKTFAFTDVSQVDSVIAQWLSEPHYNVYLGAYRLKAWPSPGSRGTEAGIECVTHMVFDFDDADAHNWQRRLPCVASFVYETSPGRFQVGVVFSRPLTVDEAKPLLRAAKQFARCDHGTGDVAHVWRLPGLPNRPNAKKHREGRPLEPFIVRTIVPWTGVTYDPQLLAAAMPPVEPAPQGALATMVDQARADWNGPADDNELFQAMLRAKQSVAATFGDRCPVSRLFPGDRAALDEFFNGDESVLDAALFQRLAFWTGCNPARMERMARRTIWVRDKWDRPDYLLRTIGQQTPFKARSITVEASRLSSLIM